MLKKLNEFIGQIKPINPKLAIAAKIHLDDLTKPQGSLGRLEDLAVKLFCIYNGQKPLQIDPIRQYTLAGDHGVVIENVTNNPQEVTRQMVMNFMQGGAGINVLCKTAGIEFKVVDMGCLGGEFPPHPTLISHKLGQGTANMAKGPAMSKQDCVQAILIGIELAKQAASEGIRCLSTGEMGIGNTTASSALLAAYLNLPVSDITGPGAGLGNGGLSHKIKIIEQALANNAQALQGDAIDILSAFGGYEIAGMVGLILGSAKLGIPCLVDGFIAQAALVAAYKLCPFVNDYVIVAHCSAEPGSQLLLKSLNQEAVLNLGLRLGEGTGAALLVPILRGACDIFNDMACFSQAKVTKV